jgi:DNA gyrase/topoisomerase IV subunit B
MYIGGANGHGLRHMVAGIILDQLAAPDANVTHVFVAVLPDGFIEIVISGAIPEGSLPHFTAHAWVPSTPFPSLTIVAAMSDPLDAELVRAGRRDAITIRAGETIESLSSESTAAVGRLRLRFRPDPEIFKDASVRYLALCAMIQERAIFHPNTRFRVEDRTGETEGRDFHYPRGLLSYIEELDYGLINDRGTHLLHLEGSDSGDRVEAVVFRRPTGPLIMQSFVNGLRTIDGGSHVDGFVRGVTEVATRDPDAWLNYPAAEPLEGLTVFLAVWVEEPVWAGSVKMKLLHTGVEELVYRTIVSQLPAQLAKIPLR